MKAKYTNFFICTLILLFFIEIFDHTNLIIKTFIESSKLWFYNLIPTLFPFLIITDLLSNYGFINYISKIFGKLMTIFKLPPNSSYAFFMSMFSGFPGNSKLIKELLDKKEIDENDATKLLTFTHFSNPLFIIGTIGTLFLKNKKISIIILIVHYLTNFIIGFIFRNIYKSTTYELKKSYFLSQSFIKVLLNSINQSINIMFTIYGIIVFTSLLINIITVNINISSFFKSILTGLIEMTQGLKLISEQSLSYQAKASIMTFFLSFGGVSIHMQIMSILANYKINYYIYFLSRIIHASISSLLVYFLISII